MLGYFTKTAIAGLSAAALALISIPVNAGQILYGITGAGGGGGGTGAPSSLYTIDTTTGAATLVGATGFSHVVSIDFHPLTGVLYGISNEDGSGGNSLITIDPATGAGTFVATVGGDNWPDIGFSSTGTLYSWSESSDDSLNTIDIVTGTATEIGPSGLSTFQLGLDVDSSDTVYVKNGSGDIYTIDAGTGAPTFVINIGGDFDNALAFDRDDVLYTLERTSTDTDLYTVDLVTGMTGFVGTTGVRHLAGLAFRVPEPGTLAVVLTGLAGLGFARRRRVVKRQASR